MINSKYFADELTTLFNVYGENYGVNFKIFADEGALKDCEKEYGKLPTVFTSGLATITSTQLVPIKTIRLNTYVVQVELFVDTLKDGLNDEGESIYVEEVRKVLTELVEGVNGTTSAVKIENVSYNQTMTVGYPTIGTKGEVGFLIDALPIYLTFNIVLFQDGVNSNDSKLLVNGEEIPFTNLTLTRTKSAESNTFNGEHDTRTLINSNSLSIDGVVPARKNNEFSQAIIKDIVNGTNEAMVVDLEIPVATREVGTETITDYESNIFIGTFGQGTASFDIATNVGLNFSIVKGVEDTLNFSEKWKEATDSQGRCILYVPSAGKYYIEYEEQNWTVNMPPEYIDVPAVIVVENVNIVHHWKAYLHKLTQTTTETDLTFTYDVQAGKTYRIDYGDGNAVVETMTITETKTFEHTYTESGPHTYIVQELVVDEDIRPTYEWEVKGNEGDLVYLFFDDGSVEKRILVSGNFERVARTFESGNTHILKAYNVNEAGVIV